MIIGVRQASVRNGEAPLAFLRLRRTVITSPDKAPRRILILDV